MPIVASRTTPIACSAIERCECRGEWERRCLRGGTARSTMGAGGERTGAGDAATRSDVVTALARLPPRVAADFVLRYHHGYNNREIARLEGVSERTVGARLAQARDELSRRLGPGWRGELPTSETAGVHFPRERSGVSDA